ncbi:(2Fe-2S)-binding protein [Pseudothermotoga sp.]|uniref:(2Fe-2S)-binding protein n=1 Tax=Pseudothermotoga sp. TaxID=2033661 RepID=UPI0031F67DB6
MNDKIFVCRCEEITIEELRMCIKAGFTSFNELRKILRVGMGPCQGRGCRELVLKEISKATGVPVHFLSVGTFRPPSKPISFGQIAKMNVCDVRIFESQKNV